MGSRDRQTTWMTWAEAARPRTLPAAVSPVLVATAMALRDGGFDAAAALACLVFALLIQIGTNFANDYYDFIKGADTAERVGPRRAVAAGLIAPAVMKRAMIGVFVIAFLAGLTLLNYGGWPLLVVGVASIICGIAYTGGPYPLGYNGLGDVFVFVFFGLVAVGTTYFVQTGQLWGEVLLIGAGIGGLATNILVVNNYRDADTDAKAGKRTLVVRFGRRFARVQFACGHILAGATILIVGLHGWRPQVTAAFFLTAAGAGIWQTRRLAKAQTPAELIELLGQTGAYLAFYALLLSAGLLCGE
ncbi:MAG: 1,4-dihydroxy-2-naphthoate polyprenyltransferase [Opitutaceae bacterium]